MIKNQLFTIRLLRKFLDLRSWRAEFNWRSRHRLCLIWLLIMKLINDLLGKWRGKCCFVLGNNLWTFYGYLIDGINALRNGQIKIEYKNLNFRETPKFRSYFVNTYSIQYFYIKAQRTFTILNDFFSNTNHLISLNPFISRHDRYFLKVAL